MTSTPHLYDQIKLKDSTQGVVKYIGEVRGRNGTFFGLEMLPYYGGHDNADTDGAIDDQIYFTTSTGAKIGRFVTEEDIDDILDEKTHDLKLVDESPPFTVGDRVYVDKKQCNGMIHYVGIPAFARIPKVFVGIELEEPMGNCDGTLAKCIYFTCEDKYGLYQVPKNITLAQEEVNIDIDEVDEHNFDSPLPDENDDDDEKEEEFLRQQQEIEQQKQRELEIQKQKEKEEAAKAEAERQRLQALAAEKAEKEKAAKLAQEEQQRKEKEAAERAKKEKEEQIAREEEQKKQRLLQLEKEKQKAEEEQKRREEMERQRKLKEEQQKQAQQQKQQAQQPQKVNVNDDNKECEAPKLQPSVVKEADGATVTYPTYMTNFNVKCRTHHKLNNFKTINYSSKKFQVDDVGVQKKLDELNKASANDSGSFAIDGQKQFVYVTRSKPHEWRAALRINTDNVNDARKLLDFVEQQTQIAVADVHKIQKFNWDKHFQTLVSAIRKANT